MAGAGVTGDPSATLDERENLRNADLVAALSAAYPAIVVSRAIATVVEPVGNSSYSYGCRIRPIERRRSIRVVNIGANPFRLGYSTAADNAGVNSPAYPFTLAAGQEFIDTSGNPRALFLSDANSSSGQALAALVISETYI